VWRGQIENAILSSFAGHPCDPVGYGTVSFINQSAPKILEGCSIPGGEEHPRPAGETSSSVVERALSMSYLPTDASETGTAGAGRERQNLGSPCRTEGGETGVGIRPFFKD